MGGGRVSGFTDSDEGARDQQKRKTAGEAARESGDTPANNSESDDGFAAEAVGEESEGDAANGENEQQPGLQGTELRGKTLGIIGLGNIGSGVAKVGLAFGMNVIAWSQNLTSSAAAVAGARLVSKEELLRTADVISIHMVLSRRTTGLIGSAEFALMKASARLVNTSRGPLVVEAALLNALANHRISGAAIDVYDIEPLPEDHPYRRAENLLATPHIGYVSRGLYERFYRDSVTNISTWLDETHEG